MTDTPTTHKEMTLLPCPFCGHAALIEHGNNGSDESYDCHICCPNEDCLCHPSVLYHPIYEGGTDDEAITAWNTRALSENPAGGEDVERALEDWQSFEKFVSAPENIFPFVRSDLLKSKSFETIRRVLMANAGSK